MKKNLPSETPYISKNIIFTAIADTIEESLEQLETLQENQYFINLRKRQRTIHLSFDKKKSKAKLKAFGRIGRRNKNQAFKKRRNSINYSCPKNKICRRFIFKSRLN